VVYVILEETDIENVLNELVTEFVLAVREQSKKHRKMVRTDFIFRDAMHFVIPMMVLPL
jgi:hypothetical protein